ncbi:MAG: hypothetical protein WDZ94_01515 [Patescibacteria group bacterium]
MKYFDIKDQLEPLIVFSLQDIFLIDPDFRQATLYDWEKANRVIKLKNNRYVFADFKPSGLDFYLLSNRLYQPSYVSIESALNHYGIIPEAVINTTAISTSKTQVFTTPVGTFWYQSIRPECFFGYDLLEYKKHGIQLAYLEKAVLDYLYLHSEIQALSDLESLRWNKEVLAEQLDKRKLHIFAEAFGSSVLHERLRLLEKYIIN